MTLHLRHQVLVRFASAECDSDTDSLYEEVKHSVNREFIGLIDCSVENLITAVVFHLHDHVTAL